jgi:hypothetical protein
VFRGRAQNGWTGEWCQRERSLSSGRGWLLPRVVS